jgi:U3 small nucleolar ribonucleoprotein protein IMP4
MLRRQARQRREFLFKKQTEQKEAATYDRKRKVKEAVESGKPVPADLRDEADRWRAEAALDDAEHEAGASIDSEYANAGVNDPKILVTTSHDPSSKLTQFLKEVKLLIPNSHRMNRGGNTVQQIVETCRADGFSDLVVLQEHRGIPDGIVVSHMPYGPTAYFGLHNVVMRHDIPQCAPVSEAYPHLIMQNLTTKIGSRVAEILKHLFPVPKPETRRVVSFINRDDFISFRHHVYTKDKADVHIMEAGPRFEMRLYQIKLGTIEQTEVDNEWVLRPYQNSAKRKRQL